MRKGGHALSEKHNRSMPVDTIKHTEQHENVNSNADDFKIKSKPVYEIFKRLFDICSSLAVSILLLIPVLVISLIIYIHDKGSPFFMHKRVGRNGREIKVCKFRSMKKGADNLEKMLTPEKLAEYKREYKLADDPRLIGYKKPGDGNKCFGAKIRRMSLDELPQIIVNILIMGNMSVVGPRPVIRSELEENYTPEEQKLLLSVKPGLTGYWQAYARNDVGYNNGERQKMELWYVRNRSFLLDIKIIFKTIGTVLSRRGAK